VAQPVAAAARPGANPRKAPEDDDEDDEEEEAPAAPLAAPASHILIAYKGARDAGANVMRTKDQASKLAATLLKRAAKEDFALLAKSYSDDARTASKGGSLGAISTQTHPPPLVNAVTVLRPGTVAPVPVEGPDGFHLVKRLQP